MGPKANTAKSRGGCTRCRVRRVKCDKQLPSCANCIRRNEVCEYTSWRLMTPASIATSSTAASHGSPPGKDVAVASSSRTVPSSTRTYAIGNIEKSLDTLTISDIMMRLQNYDTFGPDQKGGAEEELWKSAIVPSAPRYDFVHYCLSSILHLLGETGKLESGQLTDTTAYQKHLEALKSFRTARVEVGRSNWAVILLFGVSVIIFEFGTQQICPEPAFDYMHTVRVLRMSAHVTASTTPYLKQSKMWDYIKDRQFASARPLEETLSAITLLEQAVGSSLLDTDPEKAALIESTHALREWTVRCNASPCVWAHYISFFSLVPADYFDLLAAETDWALLILIHWCAVMQLGFRRWFLERWPQRTAFSAMAKLTGDWTELMTWPMSILGTRLRSTSMEEGFMTGENFMPPQLLAEPSIATSRQQMLDTPGTFTPYQLSADPVFTASVNRPMFDATMTSLPAQMDIWPTTTMSSESIFDAAAGEDILEGGFH